MTMVTNVSGASPTYSPDLGSGAGTSAISPDGLLAYCQMQLGTLDDEMNQQINNQQLQLERRKAVESVQTELESFGTTGPATYGDLSKCQQAFEAAIKSLPVGDSTAAQLQTQEAAMVKQYANPDAVAATLAGNVSPAAKANVGLPNPPQNDQWKGTIDTLSNLGDAIKSDAEIQMLTLQDLVSARQQAVEQATGMMSKEDQTLEDGAKAIGQ